MLQPLIPRNPLTKGIAHHTISDYEPGIPHRGFDDRGCPYNPTWFPRTSQSSNSIIYLQNPSTGSTSRPAEGRVGSKGGKHSLAPKTAKVMIVPLLEKSPKRGTPDYYYYLLHSFAQQCKKEANQYNEVREVYAVPMAPKFDTAWPFTDEDYVELPKLISPRIRDNASPESIEEAKAKAAREQELEYSQTEARNAARATKKAKQSPQKIALRNKYWTDRNQLRATIKERTLDAYKRAVKFLSDYENGELVHAVGHGVSDEEQNAVGYDVGAQHGTYGQHVLKVGSRTFLLRSAGERVNSGPQMENAEKGRFRRFMPEELAEEDDNFAFLQEQRMVLAPLASRARAGISVRIVTCRLGASPETLQDIAKQWNITVYAHQYHIGIEEITSNEKPPNYNMSLIIDNPHRVKNPRRVRLHHNLPGKNDNSVAAYPSQKGDPLGGLL